MLHNALGGFPRQQDVFLLIRKVAQLADLVQIVQEVLHRLTQLELPLVTEGLPDAQVPQRVLRVDTYSQKAAASMVSPALFLKAMRNMPSLLFSNAATECPPASTRTFEPFMGSKMVPYSLSWTCSSCQCPAARS